VKSFLQKSWRRTWGAKVYRLFVISAFNEDEWLSSSGRFYHRKYLQYPLNGRLVRLRECLDVLGRKKNLSHLQGYEIKTFDKFQLIALYTLCPILCVSDVNRNMVALTYYFTVSSLQINQGCTNPGHSVALASKFSTTVPNICWPSVWNFLQVTAITFRILRLVPDCLKISGSLQISIHEQLPSPVKQIWYKCGVKISTNTVEVLPLTFFPLICKQLRSTEHRSVRTVHFDNVD